MDANDDRDRDYLARRCEELKAGQECLGVAIKGLAAVADTAAAELQTERRRWYLADGSFELMDTAEEVVARRKQAAAELAGLRGDLERAARVIAELQEELAAEHAKVAELQQRLRDAEQRIHLQRTELAQLKARRLAP
jgi:chromosome segregation ATPase